jgi:hypothetical protein
MMTRVTLFSAILVSAGAMLAVQASAQQTVYPREQDIVDLRLGQRVLVDDGACPAGQYKEILGAKLGPNGVARTARCVPRAGAR